jgi:hypothetical protein
MHPAEMDELKELREAAEGCWSLVDLARLRLQRGLGSTDECEALAAAYREAEARYRARCREHRRSLRPFPLEGVEV